MSNFENVIYQKISYISIELSNQQVLILEIWSIWAWNPKLKMGFITVGFGTNTPATPSNL